MKRIILISVFSIVALLTMAYAALRIYYFHSDIQLAFNEAASRGDVAALERFHWWGANIDELSDWDEGANDVPAIHRAVDDSQVEAVRWLLNHGSDPNSIFGEGYSPLDTAEFQSRTPGAQGRRAAECAVLLRAHGGKLYDLPQPTGVAQ